MRKAYSDRVPEIAIGTVDKEWQELARIAIIIREKQCSPIWAEEQEKKFTGIYKRLLTDPIEQVQKEARR